MDLIWRTNPTSILDVGVGFGGNGVLFRQYTDIRHGRYKKWKTRIDGIEIFSGYKNPIWKYIYDKIFIGNALSLIQKMNNYDIIFLGDILEHLTKDEALKLLNKCIKKANKSVIVITPATFRHNLEAGLKWKNPHEVHRCFLEDKDFPIGSEIERFGVQKLITIQRGKNELKAQAFKNLFDFKAVMDRLKIPFALAHGTLLGAYRDKDFILGDERDTDISINEEYGYRAFEIFTELERIGFKKIKYWVFKDEFRCGTAIRNGAFIDVLVFFKKGNEVYHLGPKKPISNKPYTAFVYPAHCFDKYEKLNFKGVEFNIPQKVEDFFVARYGKDWKSPKKWGLMDHLKPNISPSLKPNYEI